MSVNPRVSATSNGRTMILSKCALCGSKKSKFIKNQKAKGLLSSLGHKTPLSKIPKAFNIAKNPKYDGYQRGLASMVYKFFDKKTRSSGVTLANKSILKNEKLNEELHKPIIRKFKRREVYSAFKDLIWAADLADKQLIGKFNKRI